MVGRYSKHRDAQSLRKIIKQVESAPTRRASKVDETVRHRRLDRRLSSDTIAELVAAYRGGTSTNALCQRYELSKGGILKLLSDQGVMMRNQSMTEEQIDLAVTLYKTGLSLVAVGKELGCAASTVRDALKARGIQRRKPGGSKPGHRS